MAWFNQLPMGTIDSFEQLSQCFLHHFAINKRYPKTASYLFTVIQREHESLRDYVQRFSEAVLEVPYVNQELLASIMQQNLRRGRFLESIAGKPPATLDELLVRAKKYIRIEETCDVRTITPSKRRAEEEGRSRHPSSNRQRDRGRGLTLDNTRYTPLNAPRAEILAVAERQRIVQWPLQMRENPKRMKSDKYCLFYKDREGDSARARKAALRAARNNAHEFSGLEVMMSEESEELHEKQGIVFDGNQQCGINQGQYALNKFQRKHSGTRRGSDVSHIIGFIPKTSNYDGEEVGDRRQARECYANSLKKESKDQPNEAPVGSEAGAIGGEKDPLIAKKRKVEERVGPAEEVKTIELAQQAGSRAVKIGTLLDQQLERALVAFLQENISAFTWDAADMCGINPKIMVYRLNVDPKHATSEAKEEGLWEREKSGDQGRSEKALENKLHSASAVSRMAG
ncbi:UNVERIFIED_CONTAM: hypothetical protein Sradi_7289600 [Sesamum radiatum]|uniref:Retrotransposon gag domain-containing protein n=1 Tax=Sesamum radiatum TaxID=300843 RepID=A0AAW2IHQ2_SESRA